MRGAGVSQPLPFEVQPPHANLLAERRLAAEFDFDGDDGTIVDHWTYVIASDGDLQEGIASEAASFAGHQHLGKLIVLYDDNHIQLDGPTAMAWSEDVVARFTAYQWDARRVADGNDVAAIAAAIAFLTLSSL